MKSFLFPAFLFILSVLSIFSYGFVDANMPHAPFEIVNSVRTTLVPWVLFHRGNAAALYSIAVLLLFGLYMIIVRRSKKHIRDMVKLFCVLFTVGILSYSAFSYDIFNYILTAKVAFTYKENPYVVMPVEIPNEPNLAFTRAANKVALYGPTWIALTGIPHLLSLGNPWFALFAFKLFAAFWLGLYMLYVFSETRSVQQVLFFALNPLVLIEVLSSGHNDIVMMVMAIAGGTLFYKQSVLAKGMGLTLLFLSIFVKGATFVLIPLLFIAKTKEDYYRLGFWAMLLVFFMTPLREELYPWYAVWFLSFAAFIPIRKRSHIHWLCIWFTCGLLLRHAPYIMFGMYEGLSMTLRTLVTFVGPVMYGAYMLIISLRKRFHAHS